jgi:hypothetical protein
MQSKDLTFDAIVAVRDLDGPEHRVDLNPPAVMLEQVYPLFRMSVEFILLVPAGQSDEALEWYAKLALDTLVHGVLWRPRSDSERNWE